MDRFTASAERRSIGRVRQDPTPRETIERLREAAIWVPNHHLTEPWHFFVGTGAAL